MVTEDLRGDAALNGSALLDPIDGTMGAGTGAMMADVEEEVGAGAAVVFAG